MIKIATRMAPDYVQRSLHLVLTDDTIHFRHGASITSKKNENAMHKEIKSQEWKAKRKSSEALGTSRTQTRMIFATEACRRLWRTYEEGRAQKTLSN